MRKNVYGSTRSTRGWQRRISVLAVLTIIASTIVAVPLAPPAGAASAIELCREGNRTPQSQFTSFTNGGNQLQCTYRSFSSGLQGTSVQIRFNSGGTAYSSSALSDPGLNIKNTGNSGKFTITTPNGYQTRFHLDDDLTGNSVVGQKMAFYWDDCIKITWLTGTSSLYLNGAPNNSWRGFSDIADVVDAFRDDLGYPNCGGGNPPPTTSPPTTSPPPTNPPTTNGAPVARADSFTVAEGSTTSLDILANDSDPDDDRIVLSTFTSPSRGSLESELFSFSYQAAACRDSDGDDYRTSFRYSVADLGTPPKKSGEVTVSITVECLPPEVCFAGGTVTGPNGEAVRDILITATWADGTTNGDVEGQSTDGLGMYGFEFGCERGPVRIELQTRDGKNGLARWRVRNLRATDVADDVGRMSATLTPTSSLFGRSDQRLGLDFSFDRTATPGWFFENVASWEEMRDMVAIYQNVQHAWDFAASTLGQTPSDEPPIDVFINCISEPGCNVLGASYIGGEVTGSSRNPEIYIGTLNDSYDSPNAPDNREYHEMGHYVWTDALGDFSAAVPSGDRSGGGYLLNSSSRDSLLEGIATFYAVMVNKHHRDRGNASNYQRNGGFDNLELDWKAWDTFGLSEYLAVASLLLDLEDGDADYSSPPPTADLRAQWSRKFTDAGGNDFIIGNVENNSSTTSARDVNVVVRLTRNGVYVDQTGSATFDTNIAPGQKDVFFAAPITTDVEWDDFEIVVREGFTSFNGNDDDPFDLTVKQVWDLITDWRESGDPSRPMFDVADLYQAVRGRFGTADNNGNGRSDVDDLFIAHGFFENLDNDDVWERGEEVGVTDNAVIGQRNAATALEAESVLAATNAPAAAALVWVKLPPPHEHLSYGFVAEPGSDDKVHIGSPPPVSGAVLTVTMFAEGFAPKLAGEITSDDFARDLSTPRDFSTNLTQGEPVEALTTSGYWMLGARGEVYGFGGAADHGDATDGGYGTSSTRFLSDIESTPTGTGYWILASNGLVRTNGDAGFHGSPLGDLGTGEFATGISATPNGGGYWVFTSTGRVFAYGNAEHLGDMSGVALDGPVIDALSTPTGRGYYMVGTDGGIFTFGDAEFFGSMGGIALDGPVVGLAPTPSNDGYWLVATDGGIFTFGGARFAGSMGGIALDRPVTGMVPAGTGYLMVAEDGGIFTFGGATFFGSLGGQQLPAPVIGVSPVPSL